MKDSSNKKITEWIREKKLRVNRSKTRKIIASTIFLLSMFFLGRAASILTQGYIYTSFMHFGEQSWGLGFGQEGTQPIGNVSATKLKDMDAYYVGNPNKKVIYLTFDAGFENGNTESILDVLKKHHAPATFFVVGHYLESVPDIINRMVAEGHTVGNHTYHHLGMSSLSEETTFQKEMKDVEKQYKQITGKEMVKYYRPPRGIFSKKNIEMAQEMGYHTFFWSLAYVDWYQDNQPTKEEAYNKLLKRIHPGAIVLLHSTSSTNAEIMDELLTKWEDMGYSFRSLSDLIEQ